MITDNYDSKGGTPMDIDNVDDDEGWTPTGQTLVGKGADGEESLFLLQKRGGAYRVTPKGKAGGKGGKRGKAGKTGGAPGGKNGQWDPDGCKRHWR